MSRPDAISITLLWLAVAVGCGSEEPRGPASASPEPAPEAAPAAIGTERSAPDETPGAESPSAESPSAESPSAESPSADSEELAQPSEAESLEAHLDLPVPEQGCALQSPTPLGVSGVEWVDVLAHEGAFVVAAMRRRPRGGPPGGDVEEVFLARAGRGEPTARVRHLLEHGLPSTHRRAGPSLARGPAGPALAFTDAERRLLLLTVDGEGPPIVSATSASERFRPALVAEGAGWLLAWTDASDTPMRVRAVRLDAAGRAQGEPRDLTPLAGGAAAPVFVSGAPEWLVFLDPRAAQSVALRAQVVRGAFAPPVVARPIGLAAEPPEVAAVHLAAGDHLAFTGVGALARSAVGFVSLDESAPPRGLVPGEGYGVLHVDAEALEGGGAVVVADAPRTASPEAPREVRVILLDDDGVAAEPTTVRGPDESARRARVAALGRAIAVAFVADRQGFVALGRCAAP